MKILTVLLGLFLLTGSALAADYEGEWFIQNIEGDTPPTELINGSIIIKENLGFIGGMLKTSDGESCKFISGSKVRKHNTVVLVGCGLTANHFLPVLQLHWENNQFKAQLSNGEQTALLSGSFNPKSKKRCHGPLRAHRCF